MKASHAGLLRPAVHKSVTALLLAVAVVACRQEPAGQTMAPAFSPGEGSYESPIAVTIASATPGAVIRYTIDGSAPTASYGLVYEGAPLRIDATTSVNAIATADGWLDSEVSSAVFTFAGTTGAPVLDPEPGSFDTTPVLVTIRTATPGASIRYTLDGSTPTADYGAAYDGTAVALESTATMNAVAYRPGLAASAVTGGEYILSGTAATPTFSPGGGTFTSTQYVTVSTTTPGAVVRYTVDGSEPTEVYGTVYAGTPVTIAVSRTLKAISYLEGLGSSMIASADYELQLAAGNPYFTPAAGTYPSAISVAIASVTDGVSMRYTTDGSTPSSTYGALYTDPIEVPANVTIRAIAYGAGYRESAVSSATYTIAGTVATPTFSPPAGAYWTGQAVTIRTTTDGASIVYTVDGTTPSATNGIPYTAPVSLPATATIRAFASKAGWTDSAMATGAYSIAVDSAGSVGQWTSTAASGSTVYVAYYDTTNLDLKLASSGDGGSTWAVQRVDSVGSVGQYTAIAAVGSDVYVSYWDSVNQDLRFARSSDGGQSWTRTLVDATGNTGQYSSIGASGGSVYVSYYDISNADLRLATSTDGGASWSTASRDTTGNTGQWTSLAVEGTTVLLFYYDVTAQDLRFLRYVDGSGWSAAVSWDTGPVGQYASARLDPASWTVYVVYYDLTSGDLKLAKSTSGDAGVTWPAPTISTIDTAGFVGAWASLALTGGDDLTVSYLDDYNYNLKVARSPDGGTTWSLVTVDSNGVGQYSSVAEGAAGIFVAYHDMVNLDLKVARSVDGGATWVRY